MKQQKYYHFLQKQILLMIGLSLIPGVVYVIFGWIFNIFMPALLWYLFLLLLSLYGIAIYRYYTHNQMNEVQLRRWYAHLSLFMYASFASWQLFLHSIFNTLNLIYII